MKNTLSRSIRVTFLCTSLYLIYAPAAVMAGIGPFGGIVRSFVVDPGDPNTLYAGTYRAGVFKSTNGGRQWVAVNTGVTNRFIESLAVDPVDSSTVYAGTRGGLFKSTNG